jgi:mannose-6-phosphate isomerase class I
MYQNNSAVLGIDAGTYNDFFPIRFDYLDTMDGENLSLQCHPAKEYMNENFGEMITQDETYYITDAKPGARVFLGFQDDIDPDEFHRALRECEETGTKLSVEKYVQSFPSSKHQLYLIPAGTVHCSGRDNLVLEISNTPYIYTFKMYDWQRLGLDGKPRPINIGRAMENLNFDRKGKRVSEELISKPVMVSSSEEGDILELPTHPTHIYRVQRLEIKQSMGLITNNQVHILNLVEGEKVEITAGSRKLVLHFAETCIIPAAAGSYRIENLGSETAKIVKAWLK